MATTYRMERRLARRHLRLVLFACVTAFVVILFIAAYVGYRQIFAQQQSGTLPDDSISVAAASTRFEEAPFSIELPTGWKRTTLDNSGRYEWQHAQNKQTLTVFVDAVPVDRSLTHLLPVKSGKYTLSPGELSDSCIKFVPAAQDDATSTAATWQNVTFNCLRQNTNGHSFLGIGMASTGRPINVVPLDNPTGKTREIFIMLEEADLTPDAKFFDTVVRSFKLK